MSAASTSQTTLLTSHKGVDLHAATALLVMKERLAGGDLLEGLHRCEMHTYWADAGDLSVDRLLDSGRFFNPNKHHYGHFELADGGDTWFAGVGPDNQLPAAWPGAVRGTDLDILTDQRSRLYDRLLGGAPPEGRSAVDVVSFARGQEAPVLSGVLWRLLIRAEPAAALAVGRKLAVARKRLEGLLVNPHMESWLTAVR
jgi:hypothetical protein